MFDDIGRVDILDPNPGRSQGFVEDRPGRAHEGLALLVLHITWLLSHEHHWSRGRAGAEDDLCGVAIQLTGSAILRGSM
jgi:hypothetical protein